MPRHFTCRACGKAFSRIGNRQRVYCSLACRDRIRPIAERFWPNVEKSEGCWIWKARIDRAGYGRFFVSKNVSPKTAFAHRIAWMLANGDIPAGLLVCHRCDNPPCVRPDHLFLGTDADNHRDKAAKGRAPSGEQATIRRMPWLYPVGERKHNAKLTDDAVRAIREAYAGGAGLRELGRRYGVVHGVILMVVRGMGWKHVV